MLHASYAGGEEKIERVVIDLYSIYIPTITNKVEIVRMWPCSG